MIVKLLKVWQGLAVNTLITIDATNGLYLINNGDAELINANSGSESGGRPVRLVGTLTIPNPASTYAAGDSINTSATTPTAIAFTGDAALAVGGGGRIISAIAETDIVQLASVPIQVKLFNALPTNIPADNAVYVSNASNEGKRNPSVDITFPALEVGATVLIGQESPIIHSYDCAAKTLYGLIMLPTLGVTSPKSGGYIKITLFVDIQA